MDNFENLFQKHAQRRWLLDRDVNREDFDNPVYSKRVENQYSLLIYDVYFDNNIINNNNNDSNCIVDVVHVNKLEVEYKKL